MDALWRKYFPRTLAVLGAQSHGYIEAYIAEMSLRSGTDLVAEDLRYFAGFLRQKNAQKIITEVAMWEGALCLLQTVDLNFAVRGDDSTVILAPSLQIVSLTEGASVLGKAPGMYAMVRRGDDIANFRLDPFQALILDLLQEDRKYNSEQLLASSGLESELLPPSLSMEPSLRGQKLSELFEAGILLTIGKKE